MNVDKIRNLTDIELNHQQRELADQLFKMKFQLKMGQTESLKKIREMKKDIARIQTVKREKELAGGDGAPAAKAAAPKAEAEAAPAHQAAKAKKPKPAKKAAKRTAKRKSPATKKTTKKAATKKAATEKK